MTVTFAQTHLDTRLLRWLSPTMCPPAEKGESGEQWDALTQDQQNTFFSKKIIKRTFIPDLGCYFCMENQRAFAESEVTRTDSQANSD